MVEVVERTSSVAVMVGTLTPVTLTLEISSGLRRSVNHTSAMAPVIELDSPVPEEDCP